jgi:type VI secretion system protein ImpL
MGGGLGAASLLQFQHAAEIRDAFFRAGGTTPSVKLDFKPLEMDATITQFLLDVDGQTVKYAHGPAIPGTVQWPGPRGNALVRVALTPVAVSGTSGLTTEGPWALFRLFDRLQLAPGNGPERFTATFNLDGRKAVFEVTSSSVQNPLRLAALRSFSCPTGL